MTILYREPLTGKKFNQWTVIGAKAVLKGATRSNTYWMCRCSCGTKRLVLAFNLRHNRTKCCGCSNEFDLLGRRFGRLTVKSRVADKVYKNNSHRKAWTCLCDCGKITITTASCLLSKQTKSCGCLSLDMGRNAVGEKSRYWKGGRIKDSHGYILVRKPSYKGSRKSGYVLEHVFVMESFIGRLLLKEEQVHHINGVKDDNRIENLELWSKSHPSGQRVEDLIKWAKEILEKYDQKS